MSEYRKETYYNLDVTAPHMYGREVTDRNGKELLTHVWHVDTSRPPVWIEGFQYKFNSTLVEIRRQPLDIAK